MATRSSVRCVLVTGPPGVGKTTLITRVLEKLKVANPRLNVQGFYTKEIRNAGERIGFEVITVNGSKATLSTVSPVCHESSRWPTVGKYKVDVRSFESLALPELEVRNGTDFLIIDEIGKMELFSSSFFPAVLNALDSNIPVLASIPIPKFGRDIPEVARIRNHPEASLYTLNKENRERLTEQIYWELNSLVNAKQ